MMRSTRGVLPASLLAFAVVAVTSSQAAAAPRDDGIHRGGFVYGAPGIVAIPIDDDDDDFDAGSLNDILDPSFRWGGGGGYLFTFNGPLMITAGADFEHVVWNLDDDIDDIPTVDVSGHLLRFLPTGRIGGGNHRVFGYGLLSPGLAIAHVRADYEIPNDTDTETEAGFNLGFGGGVMVAVWRSLIIGSELRFNLTVFDDDDEAFDLDEEGFLLDLTAFIGWIF